MQYSQENVSLSFCISHIIIACDVSWARWANALLMFLFLLLFSFVFVLFVCFLLQLYSLLYKLFMLHCNTSSWSHVTKTLTNSACTAKNKQKINIKLTLLKGSSILVGRMRGWENFINLPVWRVIATQGVIILTRFEVLEYLCVSV